MGEQPPGPMFIVGDFNGDIENFTSLEDAISSGSILDIGGHADLWGGVKADYTCKAHNAREPKRRDY
eukprot:10055195-Karenia_brevis.AAC.1